jgi:hypothetical protein
MTPELARYLREHPDVFSDILERILTRDPTPTATFGSGRGKTKFEGDNDDKKDTKEKKARTEPDLKDRLNDMLVKDTRDNIIDILVAKAESDDAFLMTLIHLALVNKNLRDEVKARIGVLETRLDIVAILGRAVYTYFNDEETRDLYLERLGMYAPATRAAWRVLLEHEGIAPSALKLIRRAVKNGPIAECLLNGGRDPIATFLALYYTQSPLKIILDVDTGAELGALVIDRDLATAFQPSRFSLKEILVTDHELDTFRMFDLVCLKRLAFPRLIDISPRTFWIQKHGIEGRLANDPGTAVRKIFREYFALPSTDKTNTNLLDRMGIQILPHRDIIPVIWCWVESLADHEMDVDAFAHRIAERAGTGAFFERIYTADAVDVLSHPRFDVTMVDIYVKRQIDPDLAFFLYETLLLKAMDHGNEALIKYWTNSIWSTYRALPLVTEGTLLRFVNMLWIQLVKATTEAPSDRTGATQYRIYRYLHPIFSTVPHPSDLRAEMGSDFFLSTAGILVGDPLFEALRALMDPGDLPALRFANIAFNAVGARDVTEFQTAVGIIPHAGGDHFSLHAVKRVVRALRICMFYDVLPVCTRFILSHANYYLHAVATGQGDWDTDTRNSLVILIQTCTNFLDKVIHRNNFITPFWGDTARYTIDSYWAYLQSPFGLALAPIMDPEKIADSIEHVDNPLVFIQLVRRVVTDDAVFSTIILRCMEVLFERAHNVKSDTILTIDMLRSALNNMAFMALTLGRTTDDLIRVFGGPDEPGTVLRSILPNDKKIVKRADALLQAIKSLD